jgi:hypothetical protein
MLVTYLVHQHAVQEPVLNHGEAGIGASAAVVAHLGSPPQQGRPRLNVHSTSIEWKKKRVRENKSKPLPPPFRPT